MKFILSLFISIALLFRTHVAQSQIQKIPSVKFKKGIYKNFESFRDNNPTAELTYKIENKLKKIKNVFSEENIFIYSLNITVKEEELVGSVFGFCDGNNFFFNKDITMNSDYPYYNPRGDFYKMENYGRFTTFKTFVNTSTGGGVMSLGGVGGVMMPTFSASSIKKIDYVIDMESGKVELVKKSLVKKYLVDDKELADFFQKDKHKNTLGLDYLLWYNQKHPFIYKKNI